MSRRKGELNANAIDRGWPHQVALQERQVRGSNYVTVHYFIAEEGLSHCPRGHVFFRDGSYYNVFSFAEREHAERFKEKFSGEWIDPKTRPRWPGKVRR